MKLKILSHNDSYGFAVTCDGDNVIFDSDSQFFLIPGVKPWYNSTWEAYSDANYVLAKRMSHLNTLMKTATEEDAPVELVTTDISAEEMMADQYWKNYKSLNRKAKSSYKNKEEKEKVFNETKIVVTELETILEGLTDKADKKQISRILSAFKGIQKKYFPKELAKWEKEKAEAEAAAQMPPPSPEMGMEGMEGMGGMEGAGMPPIMASKTDKRIADELTDQVLDHVGAKACKVLSGPFHSNLVFSADVDTREVEVLDICEGTKIPILSLHVNEKLHVDNISPSKYTAKMHPLYSIEFYQKYWKPVVESLGHIYIPDRDLLICSGVAELPDVPGSFPQSYTLGGWNTESNSPEAIDVSFKGEEKPIWVFEAAKEKKFAASKVYPEQKYLDAIVKCIDHNLESLYGRTGVVLETTPREDFVEVAVDFGRGLGVVRLLEHFSDPTKTQIEIVPIPK